MADEKTPPPVPEFTARDYGPLKVAEWSDVAALLQQENSFWQWASQPNGAALGLTDDQRGKFFANLNSAVTHVQGIINTSDKNTFRNAVAQIQRYLSSGLYSKTARAVFIQKLRNQQQGEIVAASALAFFLGSPPDVSGASQPLENRYASQRGRFAITMFDLGLGAESLDSFAQQTHSMVGDYTTRMDELTEKSTSALTNIIRNLEGFKEDHASIQMDNQKAFSDLVAATKTDKEAAIKEINDTRDAYIEFMKLKAPVKYWSDKASAHQNSAWWRAAALMIYAVLGSVVLALVYWKLLERAEDFAVKEKAAAIIMVTAAAAIATTIIFWIGRLLQRLYLSERHMAIDAGLRSTLVECYLALTAEGKIDKDERPLVLPPLFRAGSDGIVNDDTSLDGLAALAARYLEKIK